MGTTYVCQRCHNKFTNCKLVFNFRSQFFHSRLHRSSQAKLRSTIQRFGSTLNVWASLRLTICTSTCEPRISHALRKWSSGVAAVSQQNAYAVQHRAVALQRRQYAIAVTNIRRCDGDGVQESKAVHGNVALDARDLLASVVALAARW